MASIKISRKPHHPEHQETPAVGCPSPGSGGGIVTAQIGIMKGVNPASRRQHEMLADVGFGSQADMCDAKRHVRFASNSDRKSGLSRRAISALPPKADMCGATSDVG
jgi:hypothetical protein